MSATVTEQMTTGKGKLRFQIRELEAEVESLRNSPEAIDLRAQVVKLQGEKAALKQQVQDLTRQCDEANAVISAALDALQG